MAPHPPPSYRGRLAPSPTGLLHLGHARTFWIAQQRAREQQGVLVLRNENLDQGRSRPEFVQAMFEDLHWFGFEWQEGPDVGGPFGPYLQSERTDYYRVALDRLKSTGHVYPCACSRKDVLAALSAPHASDEEPIYPGTCRPERNPDRESATRSPNQPAGSRVSDPQPQPARNFNWRFRVPDGEVIAFEDGGFGPQRYVAGRDFGDFVVWRGDGIPSYQLAVVVDDAAMQITEVVRGSDLLLSTARQVLLYRALGLTPPAFYHCPLVTDDHGLRLAKRHDALSLQALRAKGETPEGIRDAWQQKTGETTDRHG